MTEKVLWNHEKPEMINVGEVTGAHGIKGQIKVASLTDFSETRFAVGSILYFEKLGKNMKILQSSVHKGLYLLQVEGLDDRDQAQALLHTYVQIPATALQTLPEGQYYNFQLIGIEVYEGEEHLGTITDVRQTGANDVYYIKTADGSHKGEILLPALKSLVLRIDLAGNRMQVKIPEGLLDL